MNPEMQSEIERTLMVLKKGGVILYPTDTVWGIGCDALNTRAIERINGIKKRKEKKSLIILVDGFGMLQQYVEKVPEIAGDLIESIDNPVTVVYDNAKNLPKSVMAPDGTAAIRIARDEFCKQLISAFGRPLVSTSANVTGEATPLVFSKISESVKSSVDYTVQLYHNLFVQAKTSTIIRLSALGNYKIIRE